MKKMDDRISGNVIPPQPAVSASRPLILYVEDNFENRHTAKINLERKYNLLFAVNDREACDMFIRYGDRLALILMDIELQDSALNGMELCRLVRGTLDRKKDIPYAQNVPLLKIPIIFVTAYANVYQKAQILLSGGNDIIDKPVDFVTLEMTMTKYHLSQRAKAVNAQFDRR